MFSDEGTHASVQEQTEQVDEDDFDEILESCIAAFDYKDKILGVAYYRSDTKKLYLASHVSDEPPFDRLKSLRFQIEPALVLLSSRTQDVIMDYEDAGAPSIRHEVRPFSEFSSTNVLNKINSILESSDVHESVFFGPSLAPSERHANQAAIRLAGYIDCNSVLSLGCINTLLIYIERRRSVGNTRGDEYLQSMIEAIEMFLVQETMAINSDTIYSLHILPDEGLPESKSRSGVDTRSVYKVLNLCRTASGKSLMRQWLLMPSTELSTIRARHDVVECFLQPTNVHFSDQLCQKLRLCGVMRRSMANLREGKQGSIKGGEWKIVLNFAFHALQISEIVLQLTESIGITLFEKIRETFEESSLRTIAALITDVIDFDESELEERIVVKRQVDDQLDEHKNTYDGLERILSGACQKLVEAVPSEFAGNVRCVYLPQLGFLIHMPALEPELQPTDNEVLPVWQNDSWEFRFSTAQAVYFKDSAMAQLDEYYGDLHSLVVDRETELLHQLQLRILEHSALLINCSAILTQMDCLLAFAEAAKRYNYVRPEMTDDIVLKVVKGRHPLHELAGDVFVENDIFCVGCQPLDEAEHRMATDQQEEQPSLILMTGANYSGKSVYLKQAALIVYMAHIGSFVPAESATIGLTDRIMTRVQSRESVAKAESAFLIDLQQVALALQSMTAKSLLIIDEFGKGTDAIDGAALFGALVEHLTDPGRIRPRTLVATHFHEILRSEILRPSKRMALKHMHIIIDRDAEQIGDQVAYLYQVQDGPSLSSFGINCAALGGIPDEVIARAEQLLEITAKGENLVDALHVLSESEKMELRAAEKVAKKFAQWDIKSEPDETLRSRLQEILRE